MKLLDQTRVDDDVDDDGDKLHWTYRSIHRYPAARGRPHAPMSSHIRHVTYPHNITNTTPCSTNGRRGPCVHTRDAAAAAGNVNNGN